MKIISVVETIAGFLNLNPFSNAISEYNNILDEKRNRKKRISSPSLGQNHKISHILVLTCQSSNLRYTESLFLLQNFQTPYINLEIDLINDAEHVKHTIIAFEKILLEHQPNWVVFFGYSISSMAFCVAAKKRNVNICLIEAGLNHAEQSISERIKYLLMDHLSDLLLTFDKLSLNNLLNDGIEESRIRLVGNIRIDTLKSDRKIASSLKLESILRENIEKECSFPDTIPIDGSYDIMSIQLPMNVDKREVFDPLIIFLLNQVQKKHPLIWIIHPSARKQLINSGIWNKVINNDGIILLNPINNIKMLRLIMGARIMLVDSVDFQEECCVLGTTCIMMRWITENPITLRENGGTTILVGNDIERIKNEFYYATSIIKNPACPDLWDGHTAERCLKAILNI